MFHEYMHYTHQQLCTKVGCRHFIKHKYESATFFSKYTQAQFGNLIDKVDNSNMQCIIKLDNS